MAVTDQTKQEAGGPSKNEEWDWEEEEKKKAAAAMQAKKK